MIDSAYSSLAMVNYPYEVDFLAPLPAWPVKYACLEAIESKLDHADSELVDVYGMAAVAMVFWNFN
jgi:lysosomal Pro-X carboxypeptidase